MQSTPDAHTIVEVIAGAFTFGGFVISLLIKSTMADDRQKLAVHEARDEEKFKYLGDTLDRVEEKLDKKLQ